MTGAQEGGWKTRHTVYVAVLLLAVGVGVTGWVMTREVGVTFDESPPETQGVWTTTNPRYAGRAIEVTPSTVTLRLNGAAEDLVGQLSIAREIIDDDERILRLEYVTQAGPDQLDMVVADGGRMYLRNQPNIVWTSQGGVVPPPPPVVVVVPDSDGGTPPWMTLSMVLAVIAAASLLLMRMIASGAVRIESDASGVAPRQVRGVWTTPDPRFADQSIRIAPNYGFSQFGPGDVRIGGHIAQVDQWRENGSRVFALTYRTRDGADEDLELMIDGSGHMRVKGGPKSVWVRRED